MRGLTRRQFVRLAAGAAAGAGLMGCKSDPVEEPAATSLPEHWWMLPQDKRPTGLLEVFLLGGFTPWETFYAVPDNCRPDSGGLHAGQQWWTFQPENNCLFPWTEQFGGAEMIYAECGGTVGGSLLKPIQDGRSIPAAFARCGGGDRPLLQPFATDAMQQSVNLGPFVYPLRDRPDLIKRLRVWVMFHGVDAHGGAIPLTMTGHGLGTPALASLGTHLSSYYGEHLGATHPEPFAYTIFHSAVGATENSGAATAVGLHRSSSRPIGIRLGQDSLHSQLLRHAVSGHRDQLDALVAHYTENLQGRMRHSGSDVRSALLADYAVARSAMSRHEAVAHLLSPEVLAIHEAMVCDPAGPPRRLVDTNANLGDTMADETATGLEVAAHLLTAESGGAAYVNVVDGGLYPITGGAGYDVHGDHVMLSAANLTHFFKRLTAIINEPGENDPKKLDLDKHMILLNTEFGRTPFPQFSLEHPGTNHWPFAYVIVGLGGPIDEDHSGIVGAIGEDARPSAGGLTPAEHRAAVLQAMGVWPFGPSGFAVGDIRGVKDRAEAAARLKEEVWGYKA